MRSEIRGVINNCETCKRMKYYKQQHQSMNYIHVSKPLQLVCLDVFGPLPPSKGVDKILVIADVFSKFIKLYPMRRSSTRNIVAKVKSFIENYEKMDLILFDHASMFRSGLWSPFFKERGIIVKHTTSYHLQSNSTERYIQEISKFLRQYLTEHIPSGEIM